MSKDRPIKSFRIEGERPFKTYNPGISSSLLFVNSRRHEQQVSLPTTSTSLMQKHLHPLQHQQHHLLTQLNLSSQQMCNDSLDYHRINSEHHQGHQHTMLNTDLAGYGYDDVLNGPRNHLTGSDLTSHSGPHCHQGEMDLNIAASHSRVHSFNVPNINVYRTEASSSHVELDPMSFEHPMTLFTSGAVRSMDNTTGVNYSSIMTSQRPQSSPPPFPSLATPTNGTNQTGAILAFSNDPENVDVKKEFREVGFHMLEELNNSSSSTPQRSGFSDTLKYHLDVSVSEYSMPSEATSHDKIPITNQIGDNNEKSNGDTCKEQGYIEKRRKNNESAKRSREARRTKEELVALRVVGLEEENMKLRAEVRLLDKELRELRARLFQYN